jgi:cardiolipin synthase
MGAHENEERLSRIFLPARRIHASLYRRSRALFPALVIGYSEPMVPASHIPPVASGSYPVRYGNLAVPLVDSGPAFRRICAAIDAARHSVWVTVAFFAPDFRMPGEQATVFDVLDRAVARELDVRVIFWRPNPEGDGAGLVFAGTPADRAMLAARGSRFGARWDRAHGRFCQHQKSWLIDAGQPSETAFVGGVNLTFPPFEPGHTGEEERHDLYVELAGPAATDTHHNFVQRWNEASERGVVDGAWGESGHCDLACPVCLSAVRGNSIVQIQRTVHPGRYSNGHPSPDGAAFNIFSGERTILEQYGLAIDAACGTIYIENQSPPVPEIVGGLERALNRGVAVTMLVPAEADVSGCEALCRYRNFTLAGIAGRNEQCGRGNIYVHAKIMLVDDAWATIGSCNLHRGSLAFSTEMNATIWDADVVRALRCRLMAEHLGQDTAELDDRAAFRLYQEVAAANLARRERGDAEWQGLAFALKP